MIIKNRTGTVVLFMFFCAFSLRFSMIKRKMAVNHSKTRSFGNFLKFGFVLKFLLAKLSHFCSKRQGTFCAFDSKSGQMYAILSKRDVKWSGPQLQPDHIKFQTIQTLDIKKSRFRRVGFQIQNIYSYPLIRLMPFTQSPPYLQWGSEI